MIVRLLTQHPRRALAAVLAFVVLAGVLGGPVMGALESSGGFVAPGADSEVAVERLEAATGVQPDAGVAALVARPTPQRVDAVAERLQAIEGVASTAHPAVLPEGAVVAATLSASADDDAVAEAAVERLGEVPDVAVGGPAVADLQIGETVAADLGRAELIAFPILLLLSLLFFRGRATLMPRRSPSGSSSPAAGATRANAAARSGGAA